MAVLTISRKQFIDRAMDLSELAELTEMLRHWYLLRAGQSAGDANVVVEAIAYAFPRPAIDAIQRSLSAKLPGVTFGASDPDELRITGPAATAAQQADLSVWREVLAEPLLAHACVLLRWTVRGPLSGFDHMPGDGASTFVLCGTPAGGAMLLKAIWQHGHDPSIARVYRHIAWDNESKLLEVFEAYLSHRARVPAEAAAQLAYDHFGERAKHLFQARRDERAVMWLIRQKVELPDDRNPLALARRAAIPLAAGACFIALPSLLPDMPLIEIPCYLAAAYMLFLVGRMLWSKARRVVQYYRRMRAAFGKLYSAPIEPIATDLSQDHTPTLLKFSAEIESLGGVWICDATLKRLGPVKESSQRIYRLGDTSIGLALMRQTENLITFPSKPILILTTRFTDGWRHFTSITPIHRKRSRPNVSGRCLLDGGGPIEAWELHRRHVDQLIASGRVPAPPPATAQEVFERHSKDHEEGRIAWQKRPYSWSDAFHDAFKICRREYRP